MSIKLLLDEDTEARLLISMLIKAGHDVKSVSEEGLASYDDASVLLCACRLGRTLLTRNTSDFRILHESSPYHPGILAIFQGGDPGKNMSYSDIIQAISNIESSGLDLQGQYIVLNAWNYRSHL